VIIINNNILVTGVPRSGTTFLGRALNFSSQVNYLWEPFNNNFRNAIPDYYPYVGRSTSNKKTNIYKQIIIETINYNNLNPTIKTLESDNYLIKILKKLGINRTFFRYKLAQIKNKLFTFDYNIFKDPIGLFLSEYLIKEFNFNLNSASKNTESSYDSL